ncbi:hypothetical protein F5Y17DRAFT_59142 [Xylariaceae sp. FL0594]|nr:hypothetical protein F5Y17DRAFT_59142 [Xylariaceae sp. FL0594]
MAPLNPYLAYKRDTSRFIFWVVKTSNAIISSAPALPEDAPKDYNTSGQVTVPGLVSLCKLIAKYLNGTPAAILELLDSVIKARTALHESFKQFSSGISDPEIQRSNASHRHFIDALAEAFKLLGGTQWAEKRRNAASTTDDQGDLDQVLFSNAFSALALNVEGGQEEGDDEHEAASDAELGQQPQPDPAPQRRQQKKSSGKGAKRKHGKGAKKKKQQQQKQTPAPVPEDLPVESYRIIQDTDGITTDYLMAVYALAREWVDLRAYLQGMWRDVAYSGLNSAVAGAVSNIAVKMIERSAAAIFVDFPGHDSHETVINTITRGDADKAQGMFSLALHVPSADGKGTHKVREMAIDVKEQFLIHAYRDLVDFLTDFQKTRSGKPTKPMLKELGSWDPNLNLQRATEAERLKWRRAYTINWLYDLVNVFSSIVVQRNTLRGEHHRLESVNWSPAGPWDHHRRIWGLKEFAGVVTHLAMQKSGSNFQQKIGPHHVFQLQCIVDSFTVSRGWFLNALEGHVMRAPSHGFRPGRDIGLFLDRENKRLGRGLLGAVDILKHFFQKDGVLNGDPSRHEADYGLLEGLQFDLNNWLGESKYASGLNTIPPSRFSSTNPNGLQDYSPYLCGAGLAEGLVDAYRYGILILDKIPEAILLVHLHNMLVQKGYIAETIGLYGTFEELFPTAFYADGKAPSSNFGEAFLVVNTRKVQNRHRHARTSIEEVKKLNATTFFKTKSYLMSYYEAGWNVDKIPDSDVHIASFLGGYRLLHTKHTTDPKTGKQRLDDTDLVKRARASGITDEHLLLNRSRFPGTSRKEEPVLDERVRKSMIPEGYTMGDLKAPPSMRDFADISQRDLLDLLRRDLYHDICGSVPYSSMNYVFVMCKFMLQFEQFETELKKLRNRLYVRAYETDPRWRNNKQVGLTYLALHEQDDECLRVMAREFENPRSGFMNFIYWDDLDTSPLFGDEDTGRSMGPSSDQCTVM